MGEYDYLLNSSGRLKTIKDYHDFYVELKVGKKMYFVPISLPRRNPDLIFDLSNPSAELFAYLDYCINQLSDNNIKTWKKEELKLLQNKTSVTNKLLASLIRNDSVCSSCFFSGDNYNPNPQKNIQILRDKGYIIITQRSKLCPVCGLKKARYTLTPVLKNKTFYSEEIKPKVKMKICKVFDFRDAYTGIRNPNVEAHIPDHKFPEERWGTKKAAPDDINISVEEIKKKYQLFNAQTNMQKKNSCSECLRTGKRGYPFGIKYYYAGTENWDVSIPQKGKDAEKGCVGCGWYDMLKWREELNKVINNK